ncbi:unnamed protein product, partial [Ectocarpus sp. 4 AP-2014]
CTGTTCGGGPAVSLDPDGRQAGDHSRGVPFPRGPCRGWWEEGSEGGAPARASTTGAKSRPPAAGRLKDSRDAWLPRWPSGGGNCESDASPYIRGPRKQRWQRRERRRRRRRRRWLHTVPRRGLVVAAPAPAAATGPHGGDPRPAERVENASEKRGRGAAAAAAG